MKKIYSRKIGLWIMAASLTLGLAGLIYYGLQARAASYDAGPITISFAGDQLFNETNIEPGDVIVKDLSVKNNGTLPHSFSLSTGNVSGSLASVLQIEPRENGLAFWKETLANLASLPNGSKVVIGSINPGATRNLQIAAIFPTDSNNDYQGTSVANFSFTFGNESTDTPEPAGFLSLPPNIFQQVARAITYNPPTGEGVGENQVTTSPTDSTGTGGTETGTKGTTTEARSLCFWWLVILVVLIASLIIYHRYIREERPVFWWIWPLVIGVVLFFVQFYFDKYYQETILCHWFWAIEAGVLVIYFVLEETVLNKPTQR